MKRVLSPLLSRLLLATVLSAVGSGARADVVEGFDSFAALPGLGWNFQNNSVPLGTIGYFQGNSAVFPAQAGAATTSYMGVNFNSGAGTAAISDWALTPTQTYTNGSTFSFFTRTVDAPAFPDRLEVRMSTNGASTDVGATSTSVGDFTNLLLTVNSSLTTSGYPNAWTQFNLTISGLSGPTSGRVAFRYFVSNAGPGGANSDYIGIDTLNIHIAAVGVPEPSPLVLAGVVVIPGLLFMNRARRRASAA